MNHKDVWVKNNHKGPEVKVTLLLSSRDQVRLQWGQSKPDARVGLLAPVGLASAPFREAKSSFFLLSLSICSL